MTQANCGPELLQAGQHGRRQHQVVPSEAAAIDPCQLTEWLAGLGSCGVADERRVARPTVAQGLPIARGCHRIRNLRRGEVKTVRQSAAFRIRQREPGAGQLLGPDTLLLNGIAGREVGDERTPAAQQIVPGHTTGREEDQRCSASGKGRERSVQFLGQPAIALDRRADATDADDRLLERGFEGNRFDRLANWNPLPARGAQVEQPERHRQRASQRGRGSHPSGTRAPDEYERGRVDLVAAKQSRETLYRAVVVSADRFIEAIGGRRCRNLNTLQKSRQRRRDRVAGVQERGPGRRGIDYGNQPVPAESRAGRER